MSQGLNIAFAGTPVLAATVLEKLLIQAEHTVSFVYTRPDKPAGRGRKLQSSPVKQLAESYNLPVFQPANRKELQDHYRLGSVDVLIVAAYGMILPEVAISKPRFGCINIHTSLLPRWRGAAPIQRAILAGDKQTGITIMQMDPGLDTGDILYQQACQISPDDTSGSLHDKLALIGSECLLTVLDNLIDGTLHAVRQGQSGITYADKIHKAEAEINWDKTASEIDRQIRAFNPAPVAYTILNKQPMRIWQVDVLSDSATGTSPGEIIHYSAAGIDVSTADKVIRIIKLQLPGKNPISCRDFFNGNPGFRDN